MKYASTLNTVGCKEYGMFRSALQSTINDFSLQVKIVLVPDLKQMTQLSLKLILITSKQKLENLR